MESTRGQTERCWIEGGGTGTGGANLDWKSQPESGPPRLRPIPLNRKDKQVSQVPLGFTQRATQHINLRPGENPKHTHTHTHTHTTGDSQSWEGLGTHQPVTPGRKGQNRDREPEMKVRREGRMANSSSAITRVS